MAHPRRDDAIRVGVTRVGVVGVGRMGAAVLRRLAAARAEGDPAAPAGPAGPAAPVAVVAHDRDPAREATVTAAGAGWCADAAVLVASVDVVVTVLPGPRELAALAGATLPAARPGTLWLDLTSGDPVVTRALAASAAAVGVDLVSGPMGGSVAEAETGALVHYVSGPPAAVARAAVVLDRLAAPDGVRHAGDRAEDGQSVKLLANALWFANAVSAAEALLVGRSLGLDPGRLTALLRDGAGGSTFLSGHGDHLLTGDVLEQFGLDRVVEELDTVDALARSGAVVTPVLDASAALHRSALDRYGPVLGELLGARWLEEQAGRSLHPR